jgi:hypothetical protein
VTSSLEEKSMIEWTAERIATLPVDQVKALRENATRLGDDVVADLCIADLARRAPDRRKSHDVTKTASRSRNGVVLGFHFVCPGEKGVTRNPDGTFWTGTWVVDARHAERGSKNGAYVALHAAKSEPSYLQGIIRDWRRAPRESEYAEGREVKIESGIDFLLEPTNENYKWQGDGAGEKGYAWG